ncbi:heavy metal/cation efflux pump CzcB/HlyD [Acetobacter tropicalis NBRC 101654]|nr:heavy metal/cation efflux pump CzcB/HlyD [Acetobacter tropicalis NBRC 101654]
MRTDACFSGFLPSGRIVVMMFSFPFSLRSFHRPFMAGALAVALCALQGEAYATGTTSVVVGQDGTLTVPESSPLRQQLQVTPVRMSAPRDTLSVPGSIVAEPSRVLPVLAPVTGHVVSVSVVPGQHVRKGQDLLTLLSGDMAQATTDEAKAQAGLVQARAALARAQEVRQAGGAATKDVEAARAALQEAEAEERRAQARVASLTNQVDTDGKLVMRAPMDGVVASVTVAPGMNVTDITAPLLRVEDLSEVWAVADVAEADVDDMHVGQSVSITLPGREGVVLPGQIATVEPDLHPETRRLRAMIPVPNPDEDLKPNMFATVAIQLRQPPGLMVPQSALLMNNDRVTVFVEVAPWTFQRRVVTISYDEGEDTEVLSGLKVGERIVTRGGVLLNDD